MWYALLDMKNDVDSMTWLITGTLQDIADAVIEQCEYCNPEGDGPFDFEKMDEEEYDYDADDYCALKEAKIITADLLKQFSFYLGDADISLHCLAEGYSAFKEAFENYDGANFWLEAICLPDHIEPDEEKAFVVEFSDFLFNGEYMGDSSDKERKYIADRDADFCIPPKSNSVDPWYCDFVRYKERHVVECFFNKLKENRRIATRFDKLAYRFLAFVHLGCVRILLA